YHLVERLSEYCFNTEISDTFDRSYSVFAPSNLRKGMVTSILKFRIKYRVLIFVFAFISSILGLGQTWFQKKLLDTLSTTSFVISMPLIYVGIVFAAAFATNLFTLFAKSFAAREAGLVSLHLSRALYRHTLHLSSVGRSKKTVGEIVSYFSQDVAAAAMLVEEFLVQFFLSTVPLILAPIFVWTVLDVPITSSLISIFIVLGLMLGLSVRQSNFFYMFKQLAANRLAIVNEWLQNIRIIRILGWTDAFESRIHQSRVIETENRLKMVTNGSTMNSIAQVAPISMTLFAVFFHFSTSERVLNGSEIFTLFWIFGVFVSRPIRNTPWNYVIFMDGLTSCRRLQNYFLIEQESGQQGNLTSSSNSQSQGLSNTAIEIANLSLSYGSKQILTDISISIKRSEFIVIVGDVGSGKTQFLQAMLLENEGQFKKYILHDKSVGPESSRSEVRSHYCYIPQDGFTMSASLGENVVLDYQFGMRVQERAMDSLKIAAFDPVVEGMSEGLLTEVGERGVNLSGGQRQRIGMARAHYHDRDIILLDDCLSAIDPGTEQIILDRLICGAWKAKTRILVTHRLSSLVYADRIFQLQNGKLMQMQGIEESDESK
ncbi:MAG: ABC transporter ATP-binding protein, partial [Proteobacteria bacterium]|nr:ABC transporter ATP-binding protein [Pseudomonadota bacterium]